MSKINNFSYKCQYKSNNTPIIILSNVINNHQLITEHNLTTKHILVLCHFLLSCWRNQAGWLGEQCPKLDSMLSRPLGAKMVELDYNIIGKTLCLAKDGLKSTLIELEQAKLLKRVLIKNKWYVLLYDEAFKLYLNNNKSRKHRINKGNIICTSWLSTLKTDNGQTDFTSALILGEITYFSRVFKRKEQVDDFFELDESDRNDQKVKACNSGKEIMLNQNCGDAIESEDNVILVSKSKGLVAYFEHDHFKKKFPFLSSKVIERTLSRLEKNDLILVERRKFTQNRKVIKRLYITLNYDLIQKGVNTRIVDFIFKTDDYLSIEQLTSFCQSTPPFIYNKYNNKTIIYPLQGFLNNFSSFSSLSNITCSNFIDQNQFSEPVSNKKWYQVSYNSNNNANSIDKNKLGIDNQISHIENFWIKKRAFIKPRYLLEMQNSLKRLYRAYFAFFDYPLPFCLALLDSLGRKYPDAAFRGENQFITYFRKILSQEKRASWQVRSRKYFDKALSLADLAYDKLPKLLKDQIHKLALLAGKKIEELPVLLTKLAQRNAKHLFSCASSFLSYMKQVLSKLKSKEDIQEAYLALPRVGIAEVASYLGAVEASYHRTGPQEHLRRKLVSTLPMTVAYHLLNSCNFYSAKVDHERNFIIPSKNKNWAEMIRGGIKNIIKDQVSAVYGQIKTIKFVQVLRREDTAPKLGNSIDDASSMQNFKYKNKDETRFDSYHLFQKRRTEQEQREREELTARMHKEEQELTEQGNVNVEVYEKYKQSVEEAEIEKKRFLTNGGEREKARELYKALSFSEWMQLQELLEII